MASLFDVLAKSAIPNSPSSPTTRLMVFSVVALFNDEKEFYLPFVRPDFYNLHSNGSDYNLSLALSHRQFGMVFITFLWDFS